MGSSPNGIAWNRSTPHPVNISYFSVPSLKSRWIGELQQLLRADAPQSPLTSLPEYVFIDPLGSEPASIFLVLTLFCPQVFDDGRLSEALLEKVVMVFLELAYNACQVPNRYKIERGLAFDVDPTVFASGRFSDVRKGNLSSQLVAVKTIRTVLYSDLPEIQKEIQKVWSGALNSFFWSCTHGCALVLEFLLGGYPMEERVSPQRP